jgi:hypothetical protein
MFDPASGDVPAGCSGVLMGIGMTAGLNSLRFFLSSVFIALTLLMVNE